MDKTPKILFDFFCPRPLNNSFRRGETPATAIDTVAGVGDRRLAASGSDSADRRGRGRATDRKGGAVALIRARTGKSLSRVRFPANRTLSRRRRMTESDPNRTSDVQCTCCRVAVRATLPWSVYGRIPRSGYPCPDPSD